MTEIDKLISATTAQRSSMLRQERSALNQSAASQMFGHIFNARGGGFAVYITPTASLEGVNVPAAVYSTKAQAKAHVKTAGAKPHNF